MEMRTSKPIAGNKFYITQGNGGYSQCIQGYPTDVCDVLANCVGYACGRFNEIIGSMQYPYLNCNAENFIERAVNTYGLQVVPYPTLGGIMVWACGSLSSGDGAGHVAIVERLDSANQVYTSESSYGGTAFFNAIRNNNNGRWGMGGAYTFRGCIINPAIGDVHWVDPTPTPTPTTHKVGDVVNINGVYVSSDSTEMLPPAVTTGTITDIVEGVRNPYLLDNGDIGWVNDNCIIGNTPAPSVDLLDLVRRTIRGDFGNGDERRQALGANYDEVQHQVDLNYANGTTNWDNIKLY